MSPQPEKSVHLSVVIPAFNEQTRIVATLEKIIDFLKKKGESFEIVVVDDGSTDGTVEAVKKFQPRFPDLKILSNGKNEGKGFSVKRGVLSARGEFIFFTDADLSTPIEEIDRFFAEIKNFDIVIGSRTIAGARVLVHEPLYREILGKTFNKVVRLFCVGGFIDTQCGAKLFRRQAALAIFPLVRIARYAFDVEVLHLAQRFGHSIKELPVTWVFSTDSRVNTFRDGARMVFDMLKIRWIHRNSRPA